MNMIYRKGDFVGFVDLSARRLELALPQRWFVRRCAPGRDAKVIEQMKLLDVSGWSPVRVRHVDRRTGKDAVRPHLGRRVESPFLPGLIFIPDFETGNPALEQLDYISEWLEVTAAGKPLGDPSSRHFEIADRYGQRVLPRNIIASLSIAEMAALREILAGENAPRSGRAHRGNGKFAVGETIYVAEGHFAGFAAKVERLDSRGRLRAFIAALMGGISVDLSETQVEPA